MGVSVRLSQEGHPLPPSRTQTTPTITVPNSRATKRATVPRSTTLLTTRLRCVPLADGCSTSRDQAVVRTLRATQPSLQTNTEYMTPVGGTLATLCQTPPNPQCMTPVVGWSSVARLLSTTLCVLRSATTRTTRAILTWWWWLVHHPPPAPSESGRWSR